MQESTSYRKRLYTEYTSGLSAKKTYPTPDSFASRKPFLDRVIRQHFPVHTDTPVIDLGCGSGALVYFARELGYTAVTGVDCSPEQVHQAKQLGIGSVQQGDVLEYLQAMSDASMGLIVAFDLIEHLTKVELISFLDQIRRVLKKNGKIILHTPNAASIFCGRVRYGDFTHEQAFTSTSIAQVLHVCGFRDVSCYEDLPVIHGVKSFLRFFLWKCIRQFLRFYLAVETGNTEQEIFTQNFLTVAVK